MKCCVSNSNNEEVDIEVNLEGFICYCFKHSKKELYEAITNSCEKDIVEDIKRKIKDPGCFCESANPSGKCCLGDINKFIKGVNSGSGTR